MNMRTLRRSRGHPRPGDIFVYQMPDELYRYGRVIRDDARMMNWTGLLIVYFYSPSSRAKLPVPHFAPEDLLLPPIITDRGAWTRGYFETVERRPLGRGDILATHCFWSESQMRFLDEYDRELRQRSEPCGFRALSSEVVMDTRISMALGFLLPPPDGRHLVGKPHSAYKQRLADAMKEGLPAELAEIEAQKAVIEYDGKRVEDYAWPGVPNLPSPTRVRRLTYGPEPER